MPTYLTRGGAYDIIMLQSIKEVKIMGWLIWLGIAIALLVVELLTTELVAVWFALSGFVTCIVVAIFPALDPIWQTVIFAALSAALLLCTRKLVKKLMKRKNGQETNLELIVNHTAQVVEDIDNDLEKGAVKINGLVWSARSMDGEKIEKGVLVTVCQISGNKLKVQRK